MYMSDGKLSKLARVDSGDLDTVGDLTIDGVSRGGIDDLT
jgi:hypothetical protein